MPAGIKNYIKFFFNVFPIKTVYNPTHKGYLELLRERYSFIAKLYREKELHSTLSLKW